MNRRPFYRHLYFWVLVSIVAGIAVGVAFPHQAAELKWLADVFIALVKMVIAPTIFCTVVVGIAGLGNLARAGRLALVTIGYFTALTVVALAIGMVVISVVRPGAGLGIKPDPKLAKATLDTASTADKDGLVGFVQGMVPKSLLGAFTDGQIIQVLVVAILVAIALSFMGARGASAVRGIETVGKIMFGVIRAIMYAAPVGAFGGMAFTVGKYGDKVLGSLAALMGTFYLTCVLFVLAVLGPIAWLSGFNILKFLRLIKDELLIVLGTSSSETVLPRMMAKLEAAGAGRSVVGLTIPTGYSFNLDGTCIYLTMGALFIAQATGAHLSLGTQLGLLAFMLISSKGAAGVTGAGLVTLAASLSAFGDSALPAVGIALLVGIDRFMSEARALTNLVGNGVATMVIARWQGELDTVRFRQVLDRPDLIDGDTLLAEEPEEEREPVSAGTR
ncbi:C4-dicarboxylate transport protein [Longispora fulva]|uniref:Aerobic C4-dicarboxylate transport protein n=1 Tax=Longispora fulva TaxID=619741 RepID=A0A8J7KGA0_9ACTN|nr:C4-dicarboxylate transporter DctA [Longispora fulva]MBG6134734.1 aerobic C4-dicarboxylate transport protein [Longispora fulva]GIG61944.1 C4-dicarboxylate transport protein [Longispora fulva]